MAVNAMDCSVPSVCVVWVVGDLGHAISLSSSGWLLEGEEC